MKLPSIVKYLIILIPLIIFNITPVAATINDKSHPITNGKAVILMDANSGRVLYERNSNEQLPPASLTKIMTALLVVENGDLEKKVIISEYAAETPECTVYLERNEVLTRMELLYAAMLPSANDASTALAESISGDEAKFLELMNQRVHELGLKNTHFLNPHGLEAKEHYSSAYDLAIITKEALSHPVFIQVAGTQKKVIPWASRDDEDRILFNQNRLLSRYDGAIGVKTGYTKQAGNCVVGAAQRGDMVLIAISMNSPTVYDDLIEMLEYGFNNYQTITLGAKDDILGEVKVLKGDTTNVKVRPTNNLTIAVTDEEALYLTYVVSLEPTVTAPIEKGDILGICKIYLKGEQIGSINMVASQTVNLKYSVVESITNTITSKWSITLIGFIIFSLMYANRQRLEDSLKRILLFLLRNRLPNQSKNHRL